MGPVKHSLYVRGPCGPYQRESVGLRLSRFQRGLVFTNDLESLFILENLFQVPGAIAFCDRPRSPGARGRLALRAQPVDNTS
jgi:hypothetical protein